MEKQIGEFSLFFLLQTAHDLGKETAHHHGAHGESATPHVINWITLIAKASTSHKLSQFLYHYEKVIFSIIVISLIILFVFSIKKNFSFTPNKKQVFLEGLIQMLNGLVVGILGPSGRKYTPFVGSLFIYILVTNLYGLLPLQNSSTAYVTTTAALAIAVFFYVQWIGVKENGVKGYLHHLAGSPKDVFGYCLVPLNFLLHVLGEFSKPVSLMFRLFGNVMAGHILVAVFLGLGVSMLKAFHMPFGVPIHFPFLFLEILVSLIQAFVFALLCTIYIAMMLPHDEEHHA